MTTPPPPPAASGSASAPPVRRRRPNLWLKFVLPVVLVVIVGFALWAWAALGFVYSSGERTGYVQKLVDAGWLCKTWEGQLVVTPTPDAPQRIFDFSVRSDSLAQALQLATSTGKKVAVKYDQHRFVPTSCFGETEFYVTSFRAVP